MSTVQDRVGPVLEHGEIARAIVAALREANQALEVQDRGSYLRVLVPGRCLMQRDAVERSLGRPFIMPGDLEAVMPSFAGNLHMDEEQAVWEVRGDT